MSGKTLEYSIEAVIEALSKRPHMDVVVMFAALLNSVQASAPWVHDGCGVYQCGNCTAHVTEWDNIPSLVDSQDEDRSIEAVIDNPDNHESTCVYSIARNTLEELGFDKLPEHIRELHEPTVEEE